MIDDDTRSLTNELLKESVSLLTKFCFIIEFRRKPESLLVIEPSSFGAMVVREDKEVVIGTMDEEISLDCMLVLTSLGVELNCG